VIHGFRSFTRVRKKAVICPNCFATSQKWHQEISGVVKQAKRLRRRQGVRTDARGGGPNKLSERGEHPPEKGSLSERKPERRELVGVCSAVGTMIARVGAKDAR